MIRVYLDVTGSPHPPELLALTAHLANVLYAEIEGDVRVSRIEVEVTDD